MKELTNKQKLQAFANYLGEDTFLLEKGERLGRICHTDFGLFDDIGLVMDEKEVNLLLRPLSQITDEELEEFITRNVPAKGDKIIPIARTGNMIKASYNDLFGLNIWRISLSGHSCKCAKEGDETPVNYTSEFKDYLKEIGIDTPYHGKTLKKWGLAVYQSDIDEKEQ